MLYVRTYPNSTEGLLAYQYGESYPLFSTGLSLRPYSAPPVERENDYARLSSLILAFSLSLSMASISSGLSISLRKKKMKAKFNRQAYAESIQAPSMIEEQQTSPKDSYSFKNTDYSFHIQDTSGRVLSCSEAWFK